MSFSAASPLSPSRLVCAALLAAGCTAAPAAAESGLVRDYMATVEYNFGPMGVGFAEPYTEAQFGSLPTDREAQQPIALQPGFYVLVGVCDTNCEDLAVSLSSASLDFDAVEETDEATNQPTLYVQIETAGTYTATVSMQDCNAADCDYGFNILRAFD